MDQLVADALTKGGPYAVIVILVVIIGALLRNVVHIPDDKYVPRELYDRVVASETTWKELAIPAVAAAKESAEQNAKLTELLEAFTRRRR